MTEEVTPNEDTLLTTDEGEDVSTTEEVVEPVVEEEKEANDSDSKDGDKKPDEEKKDGAPENYEDFTLPEGIEVDENLLKEATPIFKELNLTQDQAQKLVDIQANYMAKAAEAQAEAWDKTREGWRTAAKDDKEIGGAAFNENVAVAREAIKAFGSDAFKDVLNFSGIGDNPEMIRFLYKVGKAVKDDNFFQGTKSTAGRDPARILFPNMNE